MNIAKKILVTSVSLLMFSIGGIPAYAYTGYAGADTRLFYASTQAEDAKRYLNAAGYSTTKYSGSGYTESSIQYNVPYVRAFYSSCHGSNSPMSIITNSGGARVTPSEMYSWTRGFYKFAFLDACHTGETQEFYRSFNMYDGDGQYHAFLGWVGYAYDDLNYCYFTSSVFINLASGWTINDSVWNARQRTGITNYRIYGNYQTTLYN